MSLPRVEHREQVGPYQLIKAIGAGGSARIDLARIDRAYGFQRHVVLKRPLEHLRADPEVAASLRREAQLGGRLRHPNLVSILDAGTHDGYDYLALEYVHGASLRTVMHAEPGRVRALPLSVALAIVIDVARGVHDAHELAAHDGTPLGLVHRDVSPGNILIGLDGTVKLSDFGIAKDTRVTTLSGSMRGTVTYMAPEQCRGHAFDRRADVFSLGVILHELITGRRLFWADNDVASLHRVLSGDVPNPREVDATVAPELAAIVMAAVAHEAVRRTPTTRKLADDLEAYAGRAGIVTGSRAIAQTIKGIVGDRPVPWVTAASAPVPTQAFADPEPSLVDVIASAPELEEPVLPTFGPTDERSDELATPVRRPTVVAPPSRSPRWVALFIVLGVAGGAGGTVAVMQMSRDPATAPAPADTPPVPASVTPAPAIAPAVIEPATATEPGSEPGSEPVTVGAEIELDETPTRDGPTPPSRRRTKKPVATVKTPLPLQDPKTSPPAVTPPPAGSGSQRPARVEWKPTLLLPTDSGSATPKR